MNDSNLSVKYEVYIPGPVGKVWEALTDASATKHYFYGCSGRSTFEKGAPISDLL